MAKKVSPAQAKAAKQKKIAIGLGVLFLVVAAIQGPRMLKMLKGPAVPVAAAPATAAPTPAATAAAPTAVAPAGAPPAGGQPAVLASSDGGRLLSFELFESKDPFTQQAAPRLETPSPSRDGSASTPSAQPQPAVTPRPAASTGSAVPGATSGTGTTTPPTAFSPNVAPATATTISVNDVSGPAEVGKEFPEEDPIFVLVATASDGKSVQIGIAGGSYANGEQTTTLKLGKPLTLQNTADGSRYKLILKTVAGFAPPGTTK